MTASAERLADPGSLRIGLVCPYSLTSIGGVQNHVLGLAGYLAREGHRPHVLAPDDLGAEIARRGGYSFTSAGPAVAVAYNGSVARVNFGPGGASRVRRWARQHTFDLLHIHEPITPSSAVLALWAAEAPVVATFHTATPRSRTMQLAGGTMRATVDKIDAGIAVSESARDVVVQHLGRDAVVIPNGFERSQFTFTASATGPDTASAPASDAGSETRSETGSDAGSDPGVRPRWAGVRRPRLTALGRVDEPRKGLDVLLAALPRLRAEVPDLEVVVAGPGTRRLPAECRALGAISDQAKADLLAGTDVFVAPHRERESFGIVLLEAMASGAAVVATDLPAFRDLVQPPGQPARGRLVPGGDIAGLSAAVLAALRSPDPAQLARAHAATARYDWSRVGPEVVAVYRATLAARASASARVEGTWAALDAALIRRAQRAADVAAVSPDPVTGRRVVDAATAALEPGLSQSARERAESLLSQVLATAGLPGLAEASAQVQLARRLHNDAAVTAAALPRSRAGRPATEQPGAGQSGAGQSGAGRSGTGRAGGERPGAVRRLRATRHPRLPRPFEITEN